jgi:O-antigen/teichoic acid export membrane protein
LKGLGSRTIVLRPREGGAATAASARLPAGAYLRGLLHRHGLAAVFYGSVSAGLARVLMTLSTFLTLPLTVRYLGPERYGIWVATVTITGWISMMEFGITDTLTNTIAETHATGDRQRAAQYTSNALMIAFCFASFLFAIGVVGWHISDWSGFFKATGDVRPSEIRNTLAVACSLTVLTPVCTIGMKILSGYQQTHVANLMTAVGAVLSMVGLLVGMYFSFTMPLLFLCSSGFTTLSGLTLLLWVVLVGKPWLRPRPRLLDTSVARLLLKAGAPFFLIRIAGIIVFGTDNLIIGHYLGADQITPYSVTMRLVTYAQVIPSLMFASLWAAYAEAHARGDIGWIRRTYFRVMRSNILIMVALLAVLVACGRWLIGVWAGQAAVPSQALLLAISVWAIIYGITGLQSCLLGGIGRTRIQSCAAITTGVTNLILAIVLVQSIGILGAVSATILAFVFTIILQTREISRYFSKIT